MCIGSNTIFALFISINHILLIFKLHAYKPRKKNFININNLVAEIQKIKKIEKEIALNNSEYGCFYKKYHLTVNSSHNFINVKGLYSRDFDEETGKLYVKNH